ncbi:hypothetical protein AAC387_Pa05g0446 [Persea americana]
MGGIIVEWKGYKRIHSRPGQSRSQKKICFNWQSSGHCYRHHCPFLHPQSPHDNTTSQSHPPKKQCHRQLPIVNDNNNNNSNNPRRPTPRAFVWKNPNYNHHNQRKPFNSYKPNPRNPNCDPPRLNPKSKPNPKPYTESPKPIDDHQDDALSLCNKAEPNPPNPSCNGYSSGPSPNHEDTSLTHPCKETRDKEVCTNWLVGRCDQGDSCKFLHTWFVGQPFVCLATLKGHEKAVSGITLPQGSNKLFSASEDGIVRAWDCDTGKCAGSLNLGGKIGCILCAGPWVFIGVSNAIKVFTCNPPNAVDLSLSGPVGQVYALDFVDGMLFAGIEDGTILSWKFNAGNLFEQASRFSGHNLSVVTLVTRSYGKHYSGSTDHTIKVWDIRTSQCLQTLTDHSSAVMSILCWDLFLLSCSLDQTIKVWVLTEAGNLQVCYTHHVKHEMHLLCGVEDELHKPAIVCACNDSIVRLYDLPTFDERGRIFCNEDVRMIQTSPGGLLFTGDARGELKVWKMLMKSGTA